MFINSTVYLIIVVFSFVLISSLLIFVWKYTGRVEQQAATNARQGQGVHNNNDNINEAGEESSGEEEEDNVSHIQKIINLSSIVNMFEKYLANSYQRIFIIIN